MKLKDRAGMWPAIIRDEVELVVHTWCSFFNVLQILHTLQDEDSQV